MVPVVFLLAMNLLGLLKREDDHAWAQLHLSHYVEGDLGWRERKRLELHAEQCTDCGAESPCLGCSWAMSFRRWCSLP
jgi:hypothetical protein